MAIVACGKHPPNASSPDGSKIASEAIDAAVARDPVIEALWSRAKETGEADDLARLADREGEPAMVARGASDPAMRLTALRAIGFASEPRLFDALPFLAREGAEGNVEEADAALDSAIELAARPRRAVDPEDADELKEGCARLAVIAQGGDAGNAPRPRRVKALRALRMLADRGCELPKDLPVDLDAR